MNVPNRALAAAAVLMILACGCGNSGGTGRSSVSPVAVTSGTGMPPPAAAASVVRSLWNSREDVLDARDAAGLDAIETGAAKEMDQAYLTFVNCDCEPPKDPHRLVDVVPVVPKRSADGSFMAQVLTKNPRGENVWYVVGVRRVEDTWKIGFLSFGWYKADPPLQPIVRNGGYTLPVTESTERRIREVASSTVPYATTHNSLTSMTDYGAVVQTNPEVHLAKDGVYGLALQSGEVLSCFVFHTVERYEIPGGYLQQSAGRDQWGPFLAPGRYRSVTIDNGVAECETGSGREGAAGRAYLRYDRRVLAVTGVPKS
jgi:hypothetical protein